MASRRKRGVDRDDPFDQQSTSEADYIYGDDDTLQPTSSAPQIVRKIDIFKLFADRTQPRRAVPLSIRGDWNGDAKSVPGLLQQWHKAAEKELSRDIDVAKIFRDFDTEIVIDPQEYPISDKFLSLVYLANGIRRDGLLNPIQVHRVGDGGYIVAGERRWLAHHLLVLYAENPKKWGVIPAVDTDQDVWAQAQENGNRSPLNAIEMARQLALLIMDIHAAREDVEFDTFDALVSPGGCDRRFYAQVSNGYQYHVSGFTEKILGATGLKSSTQISQYRNLLNLDDEIWIQADEENWTENYCRVNFLQKSSSQGLTTVKPLEDENEVQTFTTVNVQDSNLPSPATQNDPNLVEIGQIRAIDDEEYPYIVVLEQETPHMFICSVTYRNSESQQRMSRANIISGWKVMRGFASVTIDPNTIKVGQVRAHYPDKDLPYMHVMGEFPDGIFTCDRVYEHGIQRVDVPAETLRTVWTRILDYLPKPPMIPPESTNLEVGTGYSKSYTPPATEDRYFTPVNAGVAKTDQPKGVEIPLGNKIPPLERTGIEVGDLDTAHRRPAKSEMDVRVGIPDNDNWDQSINPRHHTQKEDGSANVIGNIPFLSMNQKMAYLLSNWMNMANQLDMRSEYEVLRKILMWTPEFLGSVENAKKQMDDADKSMDTILSVFQDHLAIYFNDILDQIDALNNQDGA